MLTDNTIDIQVETQYIDEQSSPENNRYAFSYTISITNLGQQPVKLLSRHWVITDTNNRVQEVQGEGVVGEQPLIAPGDFYCYTSGALLETAAGTMEGSYQMLSASGETFDAPIQPFSLVFPAALH